MAGKVQIPSSSGTGLGGGASKLGGGVMKRLNPKSESVALVSRLLLLIFNEQVRCCPYLATSFFKLKLNKESPLQ